jgi:peptidoglycan/LPS O-acetylase OafA/YrhL
MNKRILVTILTLITAIIHVYLGMSYWGDTMSTLMLLNGLGYLALLAGLYYLPQLAGQRSLFHWGLILFAIVTVIAYFIVNKGLGGGLGIATKLVELVLVLVLVLQKEKA